MFYNFNRHKQQATESKAVPMEELVRKYREHRRECQRRLTSRMIRKMFRVPVSLRLPIFLAALGFGAGYCINLILPHSFLQQSEYLLAELRGSPQTIHAAEPSPKQQAFQQYLDSLERALVADSLFQSQQTIEDHAPKSIHP
ncbi:hypothetical protein [Dyadobacter sandarakinus]|uniref:Transmembrane protein n=1 Tax=Dyadobacter sandarakinus TaxID=2747268 RepID=A0ABX7I7L8_9BACT|nr:hypothetical protein [Dyadobacter sandarakinus]QRR01552.1 hypothetical protein HWI92_11860 [Dyadobacter sandarakinus]